MISLMCWDSSLSRAALIFFTCVWIPYLQLKLAVVRMLGFVFPWYYRAEENSCWEMINVCLPVSRFQDLKPNSNCSRSGRSGEVLVEEVCSICLVEFDEEDLVSQLQKCGHVFHMNCIEKWVDRDHFTCPLCRSFLLALTNSYAK